MLMFYKNRRCDCEVASKTEGYGVPATYQRVRTKAKPERQCVKQK